MHTMYVHIHNPRSEQLREEQPMQDSQNTISVSVLFSPHVVCLRDTVHLGRFRENVPPGNFESLKF